MMKYKVLWIDDECNTTGQHFIGQAEQDDINILSFESFEEGISYLEGNLDSFHAVILDAKAKLNKDDTTISLDSLKASRDKLIEINRDHYIPYFIFTGQPDYLSNNMFRELVGDFYIKGEDNEKLINDIIDKTSNFEEVQARKEFKNAFISFDKGILNEKSKALFLEITINLRNEDYRKKNLTTQRDFLESIFLALNSTIPCIPSFCFPNNRPNLEWCTRFLEDRKIKDKRGNFGKLNKSIPKDIKAAIRKLKESSNAYSHLADESHIKYPYIANSYIIMEILDWLPDFVEEHYKNYF